MKELLAWLHVRLPNRPQEKSNLFAPRRTEMKLSLAEYLANVREDYTAAEAAVRADAYRAFLREGAARWVLREETRSRSPERLARSVEQYYSRLENQLPLLLAQAVGRAAPPLPSPIAQEAGEIAAWHAFVFGLAAAPEVMEILPERAPIARSRRLAGIFAGVGLAFFVVEWLSLWLAPLLGLAVYYLVPIFLRARTRAHYESAMQALRRAEERTSKLEQTGDSYRALAEGESAVARQDSEVRLPAPGEE